MQQELLSRFINIQPNPVARLRLFCFPSAGGGVSLLYSWLRGLPPVLHVCPIQLPGRENRRLEAPFHRMTPLVNEVANAIEPHLSFPFAFWGHSFGALLAFEVARELRRRRLPGPVHFLASARSAPQLPIRRQPVHALPEPLFIAEIQKLYNAIPNAVLADDELMKMYLPVLRADLEVIETYSYSPEEPLACSMSVFGGYDDKTVRIDDLEAWRSMVSEGFNLRMFEGNHFFPRTIRQPFLDAVVEALRPFLSSQ